MAFYGGGFIKFIDGFVIIWNIYDVPALCYSCFYLKNLFFHIKTILFQTWQSINNYILVLKAPSTCY